MKIMISQPMRNKTIKQIEEERAELVEKLEKQGHEVLNTIFDFAFVPRGADEAIYLLGMSICSMAEVDAVVFMQGWENARGCRIEYEVAKNYGKFIQIL